MSKERNQGMFDQRQSICKQIWPNRPKSETAQRIRVDGPALVELVAPECLVRRCQLFWLLESAFSEFPKAGSRSPKLDIHAQVTSFETAKQRCCSVSNVLCAAILKNWSLL